MGHGRYVPCDLDSSFYHVVACRVGLGCSAAADKPPVWGLADGPAARTVVTSIILLASPFVALLVVSAVSADISKPFPPITPPFDDVKVQQRPWPDVGPDRVPEGEGEPHCCLRSVAETAQESGITPTTIARRVRTRQVEQPEPVAGPSRQAANDESAEVAENDELCC